MNFVDGGISSRNEPEDRQQQQNFAPVAVAGPVGTAADPGGAVTGFDLSAVCDPLHAHVAMTALLPQSQPHLPASAEIPTLPRHDQEVGQHQQNAVWVDHLASGSFQQPTGTEANEILGILQQQYAADGRQQKQKAQPQPHDNSHGRYQTHAQQTASVFSTNSLASGATKPTTGTGTYVIGPNGQQILVGAEMAASLLNGPAMKQEPKSKKRSAGTNCSSGDTKNRRPTKGARHNDEQSALDFGNVAGTEMGQTLSHAHRRRPPPTPAGQPPPSSTAVSICASGTTASVESTNEVNLESLNPAERRRYERNLREQQRSQKITLQIKELREVLTESKIPFKSNKFSILLSVAEYIKQLQARAVLLDHEHRRLIDTLRMTKDMVKEGRVPEGCCKTDTTESATGAVAATAAPLKVSGSTSSLPSNDGDLLFVQGIDYRSLFVQCSAPLGVASLDGKFVACNAEFEYLTGFTREELSQQSLFNLLTSEDMQDVCEIMGGMLSERPKGDVTSDGSNRPQQTYWSGSVVSKRTEVNLLMNITLSRTALGTPKFFSCALAAR